MDLAEMGKGMGIAGENSIVACLGDSVDDIQGQGLGIMGMPQNKSAKPVMGRRYNICTNGQRIYENRALFICYAFNFAITRISMRAPSTTNSEIPMAVNAG